MICGDPNGHPKDTEPPTRSVVVPQSSDHVRTSGLKLSTSSSNSITTARHLPIPLPTPRVSTHILETSRKWHRNSAPPPQPAPQLQPQLQQLPHQLPLAQAKQTTQTPPPLRRGYGTNTSTRHPSEQSCSIPSSLSSSSSVLCNSSTWSWLETLYVLNPRYRPIPTIFTSRV